MLKKVLVFLISFVVCFAAIVLPLGCAKKKQFDTMAKNGAAMVPPPTTVTATNPKVETWGNSLSAPGSLEAVQGVTIGAEVPGKVVKIAFEPGAMVKEGDLLIQLDTTTEEAQLRAAEATAALSQANFERAKELRQSNTNSVAELDAADAQAKQAKAQTESYRAVISKKAIRAPFTGRLGLRLVNLGQILREGDSITTLQTMDPIYVNFSLPQQRLSEVKPGTEVRVTADVAPGESFTGKVNAVSPEVDIVTRNIRVQATIANNGEKLRPGMYANLEVVLPNETKVLAIPVTSVLYAPYGDSVFVVTDKKDDKTGETHKVLRQQFVRISGTRGDFVNVVEGLKPEDLVVTAGVFKLRPGTAVVVDNKLAIDAQLAPKPNNS